MNAEDQVWKQNLAKGSIEDSDWGDTANWKNKLKSNLYKDFVPASKRTISNTKEEMSSPATNTSTVLTLHHDQSNEAQNKTTTHLPPNNAQDKAEKPQSEDKLAKALKDLANADAQNTDYMAKLSKEKRICMQLNQEINRLHGLIVDKTTEMVDMKSTLSEHEVSLRRKTKELEDLKTKYEELEKTLNIKLHEEASMMSAKTEYAVMAKKYEQMAMLLAKKDLKIQKLKRQIDAMTMGGNKIVEDDNMSTHSSVADTWQTVDTEETPNDDKRSNSMVKFDNRSGQYGAFRPASKPSRPRQVIDEDGW